MNKESKFLIHELITTVFYIGYTPIAPGTVASFFAMLTLFMLPSFSIIASVVILNVLFFVGTVASEHMIIKIGEKDPSPVVIDEWFGMWLALFLAPKVIWIYLLAFILFRFFDIVKPKPIASIEKNAPGGLGIMLDDACAGFFTFLIIQGICLFL